MLFRQPLTLLTDAVPAIDLVPQSVCLLVQDLHAPFADAENGRLAARAKSGVLSSEFQEYFDALDMTLRNVARVVRVVRDLGLPVVFSCLGYRPPDPPSRFQTATGWTWNLDGPDGRFTDAVQPNRDERVFARPAWGALANPQLESFVRERGIRSVMLAGLPLDFGIWHTCAELADRGIKSLILSDAVASITEEGHSYVIGHAAHGLTKLRSTGEVLALLGTLQNTGKVRV